MQPRQDARLRLPAEVDQRVPADQQVEPRAARQVERLGYAYYVAQGGDWGAPISSAMARQAPRGLLGIHINLPATVPADVAAVLASGGPAPAGLSGKERAAFDSLDTFYKKRRAYAAMMGTRPQVIGQALADSPAGLAVFMYDYNDGEPERLLPRDDFLDNVTLYWLTRTGASAARIYYESHGGVNSVDPELRVDVPSAISIYPRDIEKCPRAWAQERYRQIVRWRSPESGGHFPSLEVPEYFVKDLQEGLAQPVHERLSLGRPVVEDGRRRAEAPVRHVDDPRERQVEIEVQHDDRAGLRLESGEGPVELVAIGDDRDTVVRGWVV